MYFVTASRNTLLCKFFILFFFSFFHIPFLPAQSYESLYKKYEGFGENDTRALPYVFQYINKAKKEKNYRHLTQAYLDAEYYTNNIKQKASFADSIITYAYRSQDNDLIAKAHLGKGVVYYFYFKQYKNALNEYVKAYQYTKNSKDEYLKNQLNYHMGVVKSYLGYCREALSYFKECIDYFTPPQKGTYPDDEIYNLTKGYLNSIHQSIVCYQHLKDYRKADALIAFGLKFTANNKDFSYERNYFLKCKGISEYARKNYKKALNLLLYALPMMERDKDLGWYTTTYFYIGMCYLQLNDSTKALYYFKKVDAVFQKNQFILPELRENYEQLITYYKKTKQPQQELYYTEVLMNADRIINKEFTYLSSRIHKEYDTDKLIEAKKRLENEKESGLQVIIGLCFVTGFLIFLVRSYSQKEKNTKLKYQLLQKKITQQTHSMANAEAKHFNKVAINETTYREIVAKLEGFEKEQQFREKGLTLGKLAKKFDTNSTYLSQVINETKKTSFNKYLGELRIRYITALLFSDEKYLKYTIESLAEECGIAARQNFSDLFQEINGIRPTEFIRERKAELEEKNKI